MIIEIQVEQVKGPKTIKGKGNKKDYKEVSVVFIQDGNTRTYTARSFVNPNMCKQMLDLEEGETYWVDIQKNESDYWEWREIHEEKPQNAGRSRSRSGGGDSGSSSGGGPRSTYGGKVTGSNYETPQERGRRQLFMSRGAAIKTVLGMMDKLPTTAKQWEQIEAASEKVAAFVMKGYELNPDDTIKRSEVEKPSKEVEIESNVDEFEDDIPF